MSGNIGSNVNDMIIYRLVSFVCNTYIIDLAMMILRKMLSVRNQYNSLLMAYIAIGICVINAHRNKSRLRL